MAKSTTRAKNSGRSARYGRSARQLAQTVGSWHRYGFRASDNKLRLACRASASITGCVLGPLLRLRAKTSPLARLPRLTPYAIFIASLACESLVNDGLRSGCDCKGSGTARRNRVALMALRRRSSCCATTPRLTPYAIFIASLAGNRRERGHSLHQRFQPERRRRRKQFSAYSAPLR